MNKQTVHILTILGAAFVVRVGLLSIYPSLPFVQYLVEETDAAGYMQLSQNLLWSQSFHFDGGAATAYRMPGYPLFLVFTYAMWQSLLPAQMAQIVVDVLTVLVTYQIAKQLSNSSWAPLLAATAVAFNPLMIVTAISLRPETLTIFAVTLVIWLLLRFPDSIRAGLVAALLLTIAIYLRHMLIAAALLFLLAFAARYWLYSDHQGAKVAAGLPLFVVVSLLTPWAVRNLLVMGAFIPLTTSSGSNLYGGNNPQANGRYVSTEPYVLPNLSEVESDRILTDRAIHWIKSNPVAFARLMPVKMARLFWPLSFGTSRSVAVSGLLFWAILAATLTFYSLALYGAWRLAVARHYWELLLLSVMPLTLVWSTALTFGAARFLLPAFPVFAVLSAKAAESVASGLYSVSHSRLYDLPKVGLPRH